MSPSVLVEGENVWRTRRADRVALLVDGEAYFSAFLAALENARHSVIILSWDIDSRVHMKPGEAGEDGLLASLNAAAAKRPDLQIHILNWDYAALYAFERESVPRLKFDLGTHPRVHFHLDDRHPSLASHHQKVVVIDDRLAFSGGLDLTVNRWDTSAHEPDDPRRKDRDGKPYTPFHDVQMAVDGDVAKSLGDLARARWKRATGREIPAPPAGAADVWPESLPIDMRDVSVSIARTQPTFQDEAEVREVQQAYVDMIGSAKRFIYAETQYLTSKVIAEALRARAAEPDGPEIVLVTPRQCCGWTERQTMGLITARLVKDLEAAAQPGKLAIYAPKVGDTDVFVHAKLMIVDQRILRVGSANLSNRSMGVDSECDLLIECDEPRVCEAIRGFLHRLLGEHLGVEPARVAEAREQQGSLVRAIESLRGGVRTLGPSCVDTPDDGPILVPPDVCDPASPLDAQRLVSQVMPIEQAQAARRPMLRVFLAITALIGLALAWRLTPLSSMIDVRALVERGGQVSGSPFAPLVVMAVFATATLVMVPVNLLILATGMIFGPLWGALYAMLGALSGAASGFGVGRLLGPKSIDSWMGKRAQRLRSILHDRGVVSFALLRMVPIASYGLVNMFAGAARLRFSQYMIGTAIGMLPGITAAVLFGGELADVFLTADKSKLAITVALGLLGLAVIGLAMRWFAKRFEARRTRMREERTRAREARPASSAA